jgi:hypothetical protein
MPLVILILFILYFKGSVLHFLWELQFENFFPVSHFVITHQSVVQLITVVICDNFYLKIPSSFIFL